MHLSCSVFELRRVTCQKSQILTYPTCIWHPLAVIPFNFCQDLWHQKTGPYAIVWHCLHDLMYNNFWQTDRDTTTTYISLA